MNFVINVLVTRGKVRLGVWSKHCQEKKKWPEEFNFLFFKIKTTKKKCVFLTKLDQTPIVQVSILALAIAYLVDFWSYYFKCVPGMVFSDLQNFNLKSIFLETKSKYK